MTVTLTERIAIEKMMEYIVEERARLWTSYEGYLDRLRELDEIDRLANGVEANLEEVEEQEKTPRKGIKRLTKEELGAIRSYADKKSLTFKEESIVPTHKEGQSLGEYLEENKDKLPVIKNDKPKYNSEIEQAKDNEYKNRTVKNRTKRGSYNDLSVVARFAKAILKDSPIPMKAKELIQKLEEAGIKLNSAHETLKQIRKYEPGITKAGHGYYQYVSTQTHSL